MALPRINETLNFNMTVPSTGKKVKYRPYLVKEEKVLLQAFESGDTKTCLEAMVDTLEACIDPKSKLDVGSLATFDVEYLFVKVRSKSVGEVSTVVVNCTECGEGNKHNIDLEEVSVEVESIDNVIQITDDIAIELAYPTYDTIIKGEVADVEKNDISAAMDIMAGSVKAVLTEEERIDCAHQSKEEVVEFLNSMTATQLQKVSDFLENMPALRHSVEFTCEKCQAENKLELKGLADFF